MDKGKKVVRENLKKLALSAYIVFIGIGLSKILGYLYRVIIARFYGPEAYGLFSIASMVIGIFTTFSILGLLEGLSRFIPYYRGKNDQKSVNYLIRFTAISIFISSLILGTLLFLYSGFIALKIFNSPGLEIFLKIFSISLPISSLAGPYLMSLRSFEHIKEYSLAFNIFQNVLKVLTLIILATIGFGINSIPMSYLLSTIGLLVISYQLCKKKIPEIFIKNTLNQKKKNILIKKLLTYSIPLFFAGAAYLLFFWIDTFFIGVFKSPVEVGIYNAATSIALLILAVPELFMQLFFPMINKEYAKGNKKLISELSKQISKWIFITNLPIFTLIFLFPGAALNIVFGSSYLGAENSLRILIFGTLIYSVGLVNYNLIIMEGKTKKVMYFFIIGAILNSALNYLLIPMQNIWIMNNSSGINGAAISTAFSMILLSFMFTLASIKSVGAFPFRRKMLNSFISVIVPLIIIEILKTWIDSSIFSTIMLSVLFMALYGISTILFRVFDEHDKDLINGFLNRFKIKNIF